MREVKINEFMIERTKREPFFKMRDAHYHASWEIYYLYSGERKFFIQDSIYHVHKGDLVLIDKGAIHRTTYGSDKSHERVFIYLTEEDLKELYELYGKEKVKSCFSVPLLSVPHNYREELEWLLRKMEKEYSHSDPYSKELISGYIKELIIFILRYQNYCTSSTLIVLDEVDGRIQQVARYILNHYMEMISLENMAQMAHMSPSYFSKQFKKATGFGFKEYLLNVRLRKAAQLLLESKDTITEVAYQCGFNDSNYFGDVFKKYKGMSPMQYRKNNMWL